VKHSEQSVKKGRKRAEFKGTKADMSVALGLREKKTTRKSGTNRLGGKIKRRVKGFLGEKRWLDSIVID